MARWRNYYGIRQCWQRRFIDCMKPIVKWWMKLPGPAKVIGVAIVAGAAVGIGVYAVTKSNTPSQKQDPDTPPST